MDAARDPWQGRNRAVVVGGGIAGLLAAHVLSDHFAETVIVDRDDVARAGSLPRRGAQQAPHAHWLLAGGLDALEEILPGLTAQLAALGAGTLDVTAQSRLAVDGHLLVPAPGPLRTVATSHAHLESLICTRVLSRTGVTVRGRCRALGLVVDERGTVSGLRVSDGEADDPTVLPADLVVDASGRGSRAPVWLQALGYGIARRDELVVGLALTTRVMAGPSAGRAPVVALGARVGVLVPQLGDRWVATLGGYLGDVPPSDPEGFAAFARSLEVAAFTATLDELAPAGDATTFKHHGTSWNRFDQLAHLPRGFLAIGDAVCSFNPIYGQGITVAAQQARWLQRCLRQPASRRLGDRYLEGATRLVAAAHWVAATNDLRRAAVQAPRPLRTRVANRYLSRVVRVAAADHEVAARYTAVVHLTARPRTLWTPGMLAAVARVPVRRALREGGPTAIAADGELECDAQLSHPPFRQARLAPP